MLPVGRTVCSDANETVKPTPMGPVITLLDIRAGALSGLTVTDRESQDGGQALPPPR